MSKADSTVTIRAIVEERKVVVCCGTGGVGKTTIAAALAIEAARRGRRTVVVTIDPAKRLANTLGLDHLSNTAHEIPRTRWDPDRNAPQHEHDPSPDDPYPAGGGELHALMLDTETTFDQLVRTYAADDQHAERILANRFYRNIAGALSGTQEYMAMEKLYELHDDARFDLVVVDTPPTRHALDFLDAPRRLTRLLDNRIFRVLMVPTRTTLRVGSVAAQAFLRTVARVVGSEVIDDVVAFFRAFEGMEEGFRHRAGEVTALLASSDTAFVLVTTPRRDAVAEARFFADRLADSQFSVDALIANRVHPSFGGESPETLRARAAAMADTSSDSAAAARLAARYANLADFEEIARHEQLELAGLIAHTAGATVAHVPELGDDVHDFAALRTVGAYLLPPGTSVRP